MAKKFQGFISLRISIYLLIITYSLSAQVTSSVSLIQNDLSYWRQPTGDWQIVGNVFMRSDDHKLLGPVAGSGVLLNGPVGRTNNILSRQEFGDVKIHIEFMVPQGSNSGVYLQGRYEIQVLDSWGVAEPHSGDCSGIYQRWDEKREPKGYEGFSPRQNSSLPPGQWQSFDAIFKAPRFNNGLKIENAKFVQVMHNGSIAHENIELSGPTRAGAYDDEKPIGPLMLQGDHGPVAYRNIRLSPMRENDFFAMDTGTRDQHHQSISSQVAIVKALGYDGMDHTGCENLAEKMYELERCGMTLYAIYLDGYIDAAQKYNKGLKEAIKMLKNRPTVLWLPLRSLVYKPSDQQGDDDAVKVIQEIADMAAESGLTVALYPHYNFWMERVEDALRLAKKVNRTNVGMTFNLCHWLRTGGADAYQPILSAAGQKLFMVTVNGAEQQGDWKQLIQPLGQGRFDVARFIKTLRDLGYTGPVGLQGYGIGGDVEQNLSHSMQAWRMINIQ